MYMYNDISRRKLNNDIHVRYNHEQATCIAVGCFFLNYSSTNAYNDIQ